MIAIALLVLAQVHAVGGQARQWFAEPAGHVEGDSDAVQGDPISVDGDLGFDRERINDLMVWFATEAGRTSISIYEFEADETETLSEAITFEGTLFPPGSSVEADIDLQVGRVVLESDFVDASNAMTTIRVAWLIGFQRYDCRVEIADGDKHILTYGLTVGLLFEAAIAPSFFLGGHVLWFPNVKSEGKTTRYLELEGRFRLEFDVFDFTVGYRHVDLMLAKDSAEFELQFAGWIAGAGFSF